MLTPIREIEATYKLVAVCAVLGCAFGLAATAGLIVLAWLTL